MFCIRTVYNIKNNTRVIFRRKLFFGIYFTLKKKKAIKLDYADFTIVIHVIFVLLRDNIYYYYFLILSFLHFPRNNSLYF